MSFLMPKAQAAPAAPPPPEAPPAPEMPEPQPAPTIINQINTQDPNAAQQTRQQQDPPLFNAPVNAPVGSKPGRKSQNTSFLGAGTTRSGGTSQRFGVVGRQGFSEQRSALGGKTLLGE